MNRFSGQHIAVLGAARSGLAAARLAARHGARVTLFDEGDPAKLAKNIDAAKADGLHVVAGDEAKAVIISPGEYQLAILSPGLDVSWPLPKKFSDVGVPLTGEMEFGFTLTDMAMIAITGTNGKSTTTELLSTMLNACGQRSVPCGNHGMALCEVILSGQPFDQLALEVSSFQLETIATFRPHISLWLNFAADHLDRYATEADYFAAKVRIFENQTADDFAIVNAQEVGRLGALRPKVITFSAHEAADFEYRDGQFWHGGKIIGSARGLRLRGKHNMENILATLAAGWLLGNAFEAMLAAIESYEPPKHRCELVREWNGIEFINDSKATNLHALESCVRSLESPLVLIMGGKEKGLDYAPLRQAIPGKVRALVTIGEIGEKLRQQFCDLVPCESAADMQQAVQAAARLAQSGDAVVLSPGTSSFDMYSGYADRGEHFRDAVHKLS
jgi:UDP-N-acetylmuramoylalanine--D-glutamate ligase